MTKKKIVSFSLWGNNPLYVKGAIINAKTYPDIFPGWTCRFYVHDITDETIKELLSTGADVRLKSPTSEGLGMYYRFLPMDDKPEEIERFIVRDTDSKPSKREYDAVCQWEEIDKPFHIIRDAEAHQVHILGGTWGAKTGCIKNMRGLISAWFTSKLKPCKANPRGPFHGSDQVFLSKYVWPQIKDNHVAHIRKGMDHLRYTDNDIELPDLQENGHYVGMVC